MIQHTLKKLPFFTPLPLCPILLLFHSASWFMGCCDFNWALALGCNEILESHLAPSVLIANGAECWVLPQCLLSPLRAGKAVHGEQGRHAGDVSQSGCWWSPLPCGFLVLMVDGHRDTLRPGTFRMVVGKRFSTPSECSPASVLPGACCTVCSHWEAGKDRDRGRDRGSPLPLCRPGGTRRGCVEGIKAKMVKKARPCLARQLHQSVGHVCNHS